MKVGKKVIGILVSLCLVLGSPKVEATGMSDLLGFIFTVATFPIQLLTNSRHATFFEKQNPFREKAKNVEVRRPILRTAKNESDFSENAGSTEGTATEPTDMQKGEAPPVLQMSTALALIPTVTPKPIPTPSRSASPTAKPTLSQSIPDGNSENPEEDKPQESFKEKLRSFGSFVDSKFEAFLKPIEKVVVKVNDVVGGTLGWVVFKGSRLIKVAEEWEASDEVKDMFWTIVKGVLLFNDWILPSVLAGCVSEGTALDVMFIVKIATIFVSTALTAHEQNSDICDELLVKQNLKMLVALGVAYCLEKGCLWIKENVPV
jgi:hypothetical protein